MITQSVLLDMCEVLSLSEAKCLIKMGRFKVGGLKCKGWVNGVIINVIEKNITDYMQVYFKI